MIKKLLALSITFLLMGCEVAPLLQSNSFLEVWEEHASESFFNRRSESTFSQKEVRAEFEEWGLEFEKKKDAFVRRDEDEKLQGSTIISGQNLSRNISELKLSLEKLQRVSLEQALFAQQIKQVCSKQKSSVDCGL